MMPARIATTMAAIIRRQLPDLASVTLTARSAKSTLNMKRSAPPGKASVLAWQLRIAHAVELELVPAEDVHVEDLPRPCAVLGPVLDDEVALRRVRLQQIVRKLDALDAGLRPEPRRDLVERPGAIGYTRQGPGQLADDIVGRRAVWHGSLLSLDLAFDKRRNGRRGRRPRYDVGGGGTRLANSVVRVQSSPRQPVVGQTSDTWQVP